MTKVKAVVLKKKIGVDGTTNIKIRLTHDSKAIDIATPWYIPPKCMGKDGIVKNSYTDYSNLNRNISILLTQYNTIINEIGPDVIFMDIRTLADKLKSNEHQGASITAYMEKRIKAFEEEGRTSQIIIYKAVIKKLVQFSGKDTILFKQINLDYLERFRRHINYMAGNTKRKYLSSIKEVFNHAIKHKVIREEVYPFRSFELDTKPKQVKRNLTVDLFHKLGKLKKTESWQEAWDLFMLSFYLNGINFKDMLLLDKNQLGDRVTYIRSKTKNKRPEVISVKVVPEAQKIINKYRGEKYLLKFMDNRMHHKSLIDEVNISLDQMRKELKHPVKITTYFARHSVATFMYQLEIPESTISEVLGHSTGIESTNVYIERDYAKIDNAQERIIELLKTKAS